MSGVKPSTDNCNTLSTEPRGTSLQHGNDDSRTPKSTRGPDQPVVEGENGVPDLTTCEMGTEEILATGRGQDTHPQDNTGQPRRNIDSASVYLLQSVKLLPGQSTFACVRVEASDSTQDFLLESDFWEVGDLNISDGLMRLTEDRTAQVLIQNLYGLTQTLLQGTRVGDALPVTVETTEDAKPASTLRIGSDLQGLGPDQAQVRKQKLRSMLGGPDLPPAEKTALLNFLADNHHAFSLGEGERGETDLIQMEIDTGNASPKRQSARRMPPLVQREVSRQLLEMQKNKVIEPSSSPWASPIVLVRKRDGTHRFCVDYRELNALTTPDGFPLPWIEDLLEQLGDSRYFSTIDLASGFWQIPMHPSSQPKTAFVVPQGLFEFRVMPFGLTNAPGVFQRLMQRVLSGLNPTDSSQFVSVYLDDVLVFSKTLEDHLNHLRIVIQRLVEAGLKLKPAKCHFAREELEYLGHIITREGLKTNPRLIEAVREFRTPRNIHEVRRFLGLASYYRRFVQGFARIAAPLHYLTRKEVQWLWTPKCDCAFQQLKNLLTTAPVLAYPKFDQGYTLETDASIHGLGAVLSQRQSDTQLHPVAYASRALSQAERNYAITELETLAVVWQCSS